MCFVIHETETTLELFEMASLTLWYSQPDSIFLSWSTRRAPVDGTFFSRVLSLSFSISLTQSADSATCRETLQQAMRANAIKMNFSRTP